MQIDFSEVIIQLLVMMFIIVTGMISKKFKVIDDYGDRTISSLIINVTTPALIISAMNLELDPGIARNILIVAILSLSLLGFAWLFSKLITKDESITDDQIRVHRFAIIFGNASFLGFPLCYALFGRLGLLYASIYSAIQDIFLWTVGVSIMADGTKQKNLANILNPNLAAIVVGVILLFANIKLPTFLDSALSSVGDATMPLALIMVGSGFSSLDFSFAGLKSILKVVLAKLIVMPIIMGFLLFKLPIDELVKSVLLLEFSLPTAAVSVVMARNFDRDFTLASRLVMATTLISMITIPLLVLLAKVVV